MILESTKTAHISPFQSSTGKNKELGEKSGNGQDEHEEDPVMSSNRGEERGALTLFIWAWLLKFHCLVSDQAGIFQKSGRINTTRFDSIAPANLSFDS